MRLKRVLFSSSEEGEKKSKVKEVVDYLRNNEEVKKASKVSSGIGIGSTIGGMLLHNKLRKNKLSASDSEEIKQKLLKIAKDQGTDVIESDTLPNSVYIHNKKGLRDLTAKKIKKRRKYKKFYRLDNKRLREYLKLTGDSEYSKLNKSSNDAIILGKDGFKNADVLSHELGHSIYTRSGRKGGIIGKTAHKIYHSPIGKGIGIVNVVNGFDSGVKAEKAKLEGKRESKFNRARSIAVPLALSAPMLISEGAASVKGLKLLKQSGASKKLMNEAKKNLATAYGTYVMRAGRDTAVGETSRLAGKGWVRHKERRKTDKE